MDNFGDSSSKLCKSHARALAVLFAYIPCDPALFTIPTTIVVGNGGDQIFSLCRSPSFIGKFCIRIQKLNELASTSTGGFEKRIQ